MTEEWLTTIDAAKLVDYHVERVRELAREGTVKARKFGPVWQISRESILAYVRTMHAKGQKRGRKAEKPPLP